MRARPAGSTAAIAALLVVVLSWLGIDLTAEAAATIVGGLAAIVSIFYPLEVDG